MDTLDEQNDPPVNGTPEPPPPNSGLSFLGGIRGLQRSGKSRRQLKRKPVIEDVPVEENQNDSSSDSTNVKSDEIPKDNNDLEESADHIPQSQTDKPEPENPEEDVGDDSAGGFSLPPWASTIARVVKPVMGYVTGKALSLMKVTLQYVPDVPLSDEENDEDEEDEEQEFIDAEQDSDSEFEDAALQLGEKDRIQHICEELLTTEEDYVKRLHVLVKVKLRTTEILKPEIANQMFKDIETIYQFHYNTLLPQLQERLKYWEKHRRIGDIMKKFAPFLKLYTEYVKNFETGNSVVNQWAEKSNKFAAFLKEVQTSPEHGRLKIQAHMLEPVQRVPRYQLLLKDYLKRLPEDSNDIADTQDALDQVVQAASHFEAMMKRDTRMGQLMSLQHQFEGSVNIVSSSRELVRKGKLMTISAKSGKQVERLAFLFNDMLLVCNETGGVPGMSSRYKVKHSIDLHEAQISENSTDSAHMFYLQTTEKIVELAFSSGPEKEEWLVLIKKYLNESTKESLLRRGSLRVRAPKEQAETLGKQAPLLVHFSKASQCMICSAEFSPFRKKKHCRACGNVVCGKCSNKTATLEYEKSKPQKVCDECYVIFQENSGNLQPQPPNTKPKVTGTCAEKGFLQVSIDAGRSWKRRWFALHDSHKLYSFKTAQDKTPIGEIEVRDYKFELTENAQILKKGSIILSSNAERSFALTTDDTTALDRWLTALASMSNDGKEQEATLEGVAAMTTNEDCDSLESVEGTIEESTQQEQVENSS